MRESRTLRAMWRGAGNGLTVRLVRHSHRKRGETDRPRLRSTAPALDPTGVGGTESRGKDRVQDSEHHDGARDA